MAKSVLIMGGSRGIGLKTAIFFAGQGYKVAITYNKSEYSAKAFLESMRANGCEAYAFKCMQNSINSAAVVYKKELPIVPESELHPCHLFYSFCSSLSISFPDSYFFDNKFLSGDHSL
jgi:hypothetical protein